MKQWQLIQAQVQKHNLETAILDRPLWDQKSFVCNYKFRGTGNPRYLDEEERERKLEEQKQQMAEFATFRHQVEDWRKKDKELRNVTKEKQILECEELQVTTLNECKTIGRDHLKIKCYVSCLSEYYRICVRKSPLPKWCNLCVGLATYVIQIFIILQNANLVWI